MNTSGIRNQGSGVRIQPPVGRASPRAVLPIESCLLTPDPCPTPPFPTPDVTARCLPSADTQPCIRSGVGDSAAGQGGANFQSHPTTASAGGEHLDPAGTSNPIGRADTSETSTSKNDSAARPNLLSIPGGAGVPASRDRARARELAGLTFAVPHRQADSDEYAMLPAQVRTDVDRLLQFMEAIHAAKTGRRARCYELAAQMGERRGLTGKTLENKYYEFVGSGGNWRVLIDRARAGKPFWQLSTTLNLTAPFLDFWRTLCENNQRKCRPAYRQLLDRWRGWRAGGGRPSHRLAVPGYEVCPVAGANGRHPDGWSYKNLMRFAPTQFELTVARVGRAAAASLRPLVYTTRADLWVGSHYLFDDLWHDQFVNVLDTRQTGRPLEFGAFDLFSACKFAWGMRVRTENELTGKMEGLKEEMMRMLVASVVGQHGYSPRGTVMVVEHGTAAIRDELERLLHDQSGGLITTARSGMDGAGDALGIYGGRGKGNFRLKAAYESLHNLVHNEFGDQPGQTGMRPELRPEGMHGLLKRNDLLLDAFVQIAARDPERAAQLKLDLMEFNDFLGLAVEVYGRINGRTDHRLEGWARQTLAERLENGRIHLRRLSPWEVWQRGRADLIRFRPEQIALILGPDLGVERIIRGAQLEIECKEVSPDALKFDTVRIPPGKYRVVLNVFQPDRVYLFTAKGALVAECPRIWRVSRLDPEALREQYKRVARTETALLQPFRQRHAPRVQSAISNAQHNARVIRGAPLSAEEHALADTLKRIPAGRALEQLGPSDELPGRIEDPAATEEDERLIDQIL